MREVFLNQGISARKFVIEAIRKALNENPVIRGRHWAVGTDRTSGGPAGNRGVSGP